MHIAAALALAVAVWFILLIVSGFHGQVIAAAPLIVSGVTLLACLAPARRPRMKSDGAVWSSLER